MTGQEHFANGNGFVRSMSPEMARRQLQVSSVLVGLFAAATLLVVALVPSQPRYAEPASVKLVIQAPGVMKVQQAASKPRIQPGG